MPANEPLRMRVELTFKTDEQIAGELRTIAHGLRSRLEPCDAATGLLLGRLEQLVDELDPPAPSRPGEISSRPTLFDGRTPDHRR